MAETNDISVDALEEIVRTGGDELVTGFVRFKKVHKCNGYKDAGHKAAVRFSKITGGRILENNKYDCRHNTADCQILLDFSLPLLFADFQTPK